MGRVEKDYRLTKRKMKKGHIYYYKLKGGDGFKTTGQTSEARAEQFVNKLLQSQGFLPVANVTFWKYAENFFVKETCPHVRRRAENGKQTTDRYLQIRRYVLVKHVKNARFAQLKLCEVRRGNLSDFRSSLIEKNLSPATVNMIMGTVKVIFNEAIFREDIVANPTHGLGVIAEEEDDEEQGEVFSRDELGRLFYGNRLEIWKYELAYACFLLAAMTGMRKGEVLALQWKQINFEEKFIFIERAWKSRTVIGKPKNGKPRYCGLAQPLKDYLENYRKTVQASLPTDLVISYADGSRLGDTWWRTRFAYAKGRAKIENTSLTPHKLRHTLTTMLREGKMPTDKVRAWFGWSNKGMEETYTHWKPEHFPDLTKEVEKIWTEIEAITPRVSY